MLFEYSDINVIRIGLQPTENISSESGEVVAGPFHPSFRQFVESKIYGLVLDEFLEENSIEDADMKIEVNKKQISNIVGQKSVNIKTIREKFNLRKVTVHGADISQESFYIIYKGQKYEVKRRKYIEKYLKNNKYI